MIQIVFRWWRYPSKPKYRRYKTLPCLLPILITVARSKHCGRDIAQSKVCEVPVAGRILSDAILALPATRVQMGALNIHFFLLFRRFILFTKNRGEFLWSIWRDISTLRNTIKNHWISLRKVKLREFEELFRLGFSLYFLQPTHVSRAHNFFGLIFDISCKRNERLDRRK